MKKEYVKYNSNKLKKIFTDFLYLFTPMLLIAVLVFYGINKWEIKTQKKAIEIQQEQEIEWTKQSVETLFSNIIADLKILRDSNEIKEYLDNYSKESIKKIEEIFSNFSIQKNIYDQIRLIDDSGMEIVRVNYKNGTAQIIDSKLLQNKYDRYYFKNSIGLNSDEYYVSPFDLNIEAGEIEKPIKPIIRFSIPITDKYGNNKGIIILNYLGNEILNEIDDHEKHNEKLKIFLINKNGYWIRSGDAEKNWAFMYRGKEDVSITNENPILWDKLKNSKSGTFNNGDGQYYYDTIYPLLNIDNNKKVSIRSKENDLYWKIISYYSNENLSLFNNIRGKRLLATGFGIVILLFIFSIVLACIIYYRREEAHKLKLAGRIFENTSEAVVITDENTNILYVNKAFTKITGYKKDEIIGNKTSSFKSGKHDEEFYRSMWESIIKYGTWQGEIWDKKKNEEYYPKWLTINLIRNNDKNSVRYIGVFEDLTEAKKKDEHIDRLKNYDILTELPNQLLL